ncbi:MAG TPA: DUF1631 family protein [Pseudomonadales bacterium]|nr:DUF1631 family protein [Pseudomonadales bacterium]
MTSIADRRETRVAIELDAIVHPDKGRTWACCIRDFCESGMFLQSTTGNADRSLRNSGVDVRPGDEVSIHFSVPGKDGTQNFRISGEVARVLESALGIYFPDGIALRAHRALEAFARSKQFRDVGDTYGDRRGARDGSPLDPVVADQVIAELVRLVRQAMPQLLAAFFARAEEELIVLARDAGSNVRQHRLFEALNSVEHNSQEVSLNAVDAVVQRLEQRNDGSPIATRRSEGGASANLSLVDNDQFEDWLALADVISKAENRFSEELLQLSLQTALLAPGWREKDAMPVGPAVIASAFDQAMRSISLERDVRQLLYGYFRDALVAFLRKLYPAVSKLLADSGAFPDAEEMANEMRRRQAQKAGTKAPPEEPTPPEEAEEVGDERADAAGGQATAAGARSGRGETRAGNARPGDGTARQGHPNAGHPSAGHSDAGHPDAGHPDQGYAGHDPEEPGYPEQGHAEQGRPRQGRSGQGGAAQGRPRQGAASAGATGGRQSASAGDLAAATARAYARPVAGPMNDMYGTARELMQLRRGLPGPDGLPTEMPWGSEVQGGAPENTYTREEVMSALASLAQGGGQVDAADGAYAYADGHLGLARRIGRALGGAKALPPEARDALEIVDGLIGSIRADAYVPESAKSWFDSLEVSLGKLATEDQDFLDTSSQPMHPALRLLNELAELGNAADAGDGIDQALRAQVDGILARTAADYEGDPAVFDQALLELAPLVDRHRRSFEGNIQRVVRQSEGASRLVTARRAVVQQMDDRLTGRDVPELVLELLNPGWRNLLVHSHLRHGADSREYRDNLKVVDDVVRAIETGRGDRDEIVARVTDGLESIAYEPGRRRQLLSRLTAALEGRLATSPVHVDPGTVADLLGLARQLPDTAPESEAEGAAARERWEHFLSIARELEVGAWLGVDDDAGRTRIVTVAWIGDEHAAFTLVNRKGVKVHDMDLREMVQGLVDDRVQVLNEFDMPLMERASQSMLQNMHNQLAYQATHDALTGLVNRKEYERAVIEAVREAEAEGIEGAILFVDLDQFKIINNTSGHDAGDELLRSIVPNLRHELRGVRGTLARLGGDEFGVLLERCSGEESLATAEKFLKAVRDFRFDWEGEQYALTASIGYVAFGMDDREASTLLQQADSACYAAKDAGRNRILVFEIADQKMAARRGVMEWVQKVDRVLRDDRIRLTAQKILPILDPDRALHYEVLMTVLNEEGEPMPPLDFITAAETYDRMPAVDRWIVSHTLAWMSANLARLKHIHGFSINLSGTSLNEPGFLDFVIKELTASRVPTSKITFEITETAAIGSMDGANRFIRRLKELGCTFSLDDFGTGLSSYSYLRNLEVDYVKIDGVFVKDLVDSPADYAVVKSVNEIAHFMGKETIAEFVETQEIIDALKEIGVDYAQGWGVERPKPLKNFFDS